MKTRILKIALAVLFFALLALPLLRFVGARETWTDLAGWERPVELPKLSLSTFTNRQFQSALTEEYSKKFFLRQSALKTALQLKDWANLGLFHAGYSESIHEGRDGVLFERPYAEFHFGEPDRPLDRAKYAKVLGTLKEIDAYCRSIGAAFVYVTVPDKGQVYPEYQPRWYDWFWTRHENDIQGKMSELCAKEGLLAFDARRFLLTEKAKTDKWLYPPFGTHLNALGNALLLEAVVGRLAEAGRLELKVNPLRETVPIDRPWNADDELMLLFNTWDMRRLGENVRYAPRYAETNVVMNAGSAIFFGDCFRTQLAVTARESGLFAKDKVVACERHGRQKAEGLKGVAKDLRLVAMVFQSFNTARLDEREAEIRSIFEALKEARRTADSPAAMPFVTILPGKEPVCVRQD